jgi:hydrogenase expression/formation protein HypE
MLDLLEEVVYPALGKSALPDGEDAAALLLDGAEPGFRLACTTDSFVVKPLFFPGGDIGKLAVCGTVNDLSMRGARPLYLTLGLILEEGLPREVLGRVLSSAGHWAERAGVRIVAGDTKVVEKGAADGMYINTAGVGIIPPGREVSIRGARPGDLLLVSGCVGDHETAVLSRREGFDFQVEVESDCAPLNALVETMLEVGEVHALRDPTRGGLAASLKEMASASGVSLEVREADIPVREGVRAFCEMLGLDPLLLANEGKLLAAVHPESAPAVLEAMRAHPLGREAAVIGSVLEGPRGRVSILTPLGSSRLLRMPSGEHFPRIC